MKLPTAARVAIAVALGALLVPHWLPGTPDHRAAELTYLAGLVLPLLWALLPIKPQPASARANRRIAQDSPAPRA